MLIFNVSYNCSQAVLLGTVGWNMGFPSDRQFQCSETYFDAYSEMYYT